MKGFKIFASWEPRAETPQILGERMLGNLDALSDVSPFFGDWQLHDLRLDPLEMDPEEFDEQFFRLDEVREHMPEIVEHGVRRNDDGEPEPSGGYTIIARNDDSNPSRYVSLYARGGGIVNPRAGLRFVKFSSSEDTAPDCAIVSYPVFKAVLKSVVSAWGVRHAQAYSDRLSKLWRQPSKLFLDLAWMTYLSPELAQNFTPPRDVLVEHVDDGGLLIIAAEETFDTANPKHMAAAQSILKSLAAINAEEEKLSDRLWPRRRLS
jgi:hypothetical protein